LTSSAHSTIKVTLVESETHQNIEKKRGNIIFCLKCGKELPPQAIYCLYCGAALQQLARRKSKNTAVMLAVSLSWLTWLYTYKKDAWKFWFGLGLGTVSIGLICVYIIKAFEDAMNMVDQAMAGSLSETQLVGSTSGWSTWGTIASVVVFGIWVWSIVDTAIKSREWYNSYYA